ncbi:hypothetical protein ACFOWB_18920 [Chenggangzhangella methanolivorans]|uniref:hypothetical protein n=1 Tax=Chenggangzhangella methanolivorans TaxID=1437009 RepID=UPI00361748AF
MTDKPSVYGTDTSKPNEKAGVEVGGGEKPAAATNKEAREEAEPGSADDDREPPAPEDPEEAQSPT